MSACKKCGAPMVWAVTNEGRRIPINTAADPDGNVWLERSRDWRQLIARFDEPPDDEIIRPLFTTHFQTCPFANEFRKKAARGGRP